MLCCARLLSPSIVHLLACDGPTAGCQGLPAIPPCTLRNTHSVRMARVPLNSVISDVPNRPRPSYLNGLQDYQAHHQHHISITGRLLSGHINVPYWTHSTAPRAGHTTGHFRRRKQLCYCSQQHLPCRIGGTLHVRNSFARSIYPRNRRAIQQ